MKKRIYQDLTSVHMDKSKEKLYQFDPNIIAEIEEYISVYL
jgi:hypothetical protein